MDLPGGFGVAELSAAIEASLAAGDAEILGRSLAVRQFLGGFGDPAGATPGFADAVAAAERDGDPFGRCCAHAYAALSAIFGCDRPDVAQPHLDALAEAAGTGPYWACWQHLALGLIEWRAGRLTGARATLTEGLALAEAVGDPMLKSW
jgi:hypothetical protein